MTALHETLFDLWIWVQEVGNLILLECSPISALTLDLIDDAPSRALGYLPLIHNYMHSYFCGAEDVGSKNQP